LDCLGIEYHTQQIHFVKPYYFAGANQTVKDIADIYSENKGSEQPTIASHNTFWNGTIGNGLPFHTANNYEYGLNEDSIYNRWMDVGEKMLSSVSAGGVLTPFELSFVADGINIIRMRYRPSGDNTPSVTIKNAKVTNPKTVGAQEGMLSNPTGSNVLAWGSNDHGTLPVEFSKYESQLMTFRFRPEWDSTITYVTDAKVKVTASDGTAQHYKSLVDSNLNNTPPGPTAGSQDSNANWEQIDMKSEFGDNIQYSPWTDDKSGVWLKSFANPSGVFHSGAVLAWDINLVVWEDGFFRTWVDALATSNAALDALANTSSEGYAYSHTRATLPRGFRVLVNSASPTGDLANFANMVAEYDGSTWRKKYSFDANNDKVQIAAIHPGIVYEGDDFGTHRS
jgi:hypothetical protein